MSLAQLKRDAADGKMRLELHERFGRKADEIPDNLKGIRKVLAVKSNHFVLSAKETSVSKLHYRSAKLVDYDGENLIIYNPGVRKPTAEEMQLLEEWNNQEKDFYKNNPYGNIYYRKKSFFEGSTFPYMSGFGTRRGKLYVKTQDGGHVMDNQLKGDVILKYHVLFEQSKGVLYEYFEQALQKHGYAITEEKLTEVLTDYENCQEWRDGVRLTGNTYEEVEDFVAFSPCIKEIYN